MNAQRRIVIVGAGQAGGRTAQALRRAGHAGPVTLIGQEACGPYERPPLSKGILLGTASAQSLQLFDEAGWAALGVDLRCATQVASIRRDRHEVVLGDGVVMPYDALVLATGARARAFTGPVEAGAALHGLRTIEDALCLRAALAPGRRLAVIGAGFIGLELAASARRLGVEVVLIESAARPLARLLPPLAADWLMAMHAAHGVGFRLGAQVESVGPHDVRLRGGETVDADLVAVGIGAVPNDELAREAGLRVRDGVLVDADGRTTDPAVFAVGDVARHVEPSRGIDVRLESWRNAEDQAVAVAAALCGLDPVPRPVPWFWTDQYDRNIQLAGQPLAGDEIVVRGEFTPGPCLAYFLADGLVRGVIGVDCGRDVRAAQKLIQQALPVDPAALPGPRIRARAAAPG